MCVLRITSDQLIWSNKGLWSIFPLFTASFIAVFLYNPLYSPAAYPECLHPSWPSHRIAKSRSIIYLLNLKIYFTSYFGTRDNQPLHNPYTSYFPSLHSTIHPPGMQKNNKKIVWKKSKNSFIYKSDGICVWCEPSNGKYLRAFAIIWLLYGYTWEDTRAVDGIAGEYVQS